MAGDKRSAEWTRLDTLFSELMQECKLSAPGARLSARLRTSLERLDPDTRRTIVSRKKEGCAPLFVASRRGNTEIVEYLISVCDAPLEQKGIYSQPEERTVHCVTALWAAAVAGQLGCVRALAAAGAALDARSDSGSTPARSACFMTHEHVVQFLIESGADINLPNHNGGTCLINAVQSAALCRLLLQAGAAVNARDQQRKTALHYAVQEHRAETAALLLAWGADATLQSRAGDDALRTACVKGAAGIAATLAALPVYSRADRADAHELLGATQLDEFNDPAACLAHWHTATALRHAGPYLPKLPVRSPAAALRSQEWTSPEQLAALATDMDEVRAQALLVAHRVLGPHHKDTVFRLMYRGASYADAFRYQRCIELWAWALQIRIQKDTILYTDTCHTACALARLLLDAWCGRLERGAALAHHHVAAVYDTLAAALPEARALLAVRPTHKKQAETWDRALRCLTHLLYLLLHTAESEEEREAVDTRCRALVAEDLRAAHTGDTLLHVVVSRLNVVRSTYIADPAPRSPQIFPSVSVARLLLRCGASPGARNDAGCTPLHVAAIPYNCSTELLELLIEWGAHMDQPNRFGDSALTLAGARLRRRRPEPLRCLAARALAAARPPLPPAHLTPAHLPRTLHAFLQLHTPPA